MSRNRWMKFWPGDWRGDSALRACSAAARGFWIDCLTIMHEAEPYGHLLIGGQPPTPRRLAQVLSMREKEVVSLIEELRSAGVCSETEDGTLYSRRMVRDAQASDIAREHGRRGGNPTLKPLRGGLTPPLNHPLKLEAEAEAEKTLPYPLEEGGKGVSPAGAGEASAADDDEPERTKVPRAKHAVPQDTLLAMAATWNSMAGEAGLPQVSELTKKRAITLRARIAERWTKDPTAQFGAYCQAIAATPFLRGENKNGWRADFDWALKPDSPVRVQEGKYQDEGGAAA